MNIKSNIMKIDQGMDGKIRKISKDSLNKIRNQMSRQINFQVDNELDIEINLENEIYYQIFNAVNKLT